MKPDIIKLCADSLRTFAFTKHGIKLKAAHAHELGAAYFGYPSKNALLADTKYPVGNLGQAEIIVMISETFIDQRRKELEDLSPELPDSYTLGEAIYAPLFTDLWWRKSPFPPFRSFEKLAKTVVENNDAYKAAFPFYRDVPAHHILDMKIADDEVILTVQHANQTSSGDMLVFGDTTIRLPRVAGRIGYGKPYVSVQAYAGNARKTLRPTETLQ